MIEQQQLQQFVRTHWGLDVQIIHFLRTENKQIMEIKDVQGASYILKGEQQQAHEVEVVCQFASTMQHVLPIATYLQSKKGTYGVAVGHFVYTLETKCYGEEITTMNDTLLAEIASMLARAHDYAHKKQLKLHRATSWAMFGGNKTDNIGDYDENELSFLEFKQAFEQHKTFPVIEERYNKHRETLKTMWPKLPTAAVQGDFCPYNMLFQQQKLVALFDFNLAGDEVLINECIALSIYLNWHVAYDGTKTAQERYTLFLASYEAIRPFTALERQAIPHLFAIIRAFRYDRIEEGIASADANEFVEQTKMILQHEYTCKTRF